MLPGHAEHALVTPDWEAWGCTLAQGLYSGMMWGGHKRPARPFVGCRAAQAGGVKAYPGKQLDAVAHLPVHCPAVSQILHGDNLLAAVQGQAHMGDNLWLWLAPSDGGQALCRTKKGNAGGACDLLTGGLCPSDSTPGWSDDGHLKDA